MAAKSKAKSKKSAPSKSTRNESSAKVRISPNGKSRSSAATSSEIHSYSIQGQVVDRRPVETAADSIGAAGTATGSTAGAATPTAASKKRKHVPSAKPASYGYFDSENKEFVITRPDTPLPWINYIGSEAYCGLVSNTGGGYSFYRDPREMRLTRYRYNNIPADRGGRYIYIRDNSDGAFWSTTWQPVCPPLAADYKDVPAAEKPRDLYEYECRVGLGYTTIQSRMRGIKTKTTYTVPLGENLELWMVEVENENDAPRSLTTFSFVEFCLWDAFNDMTDYQYNLNIGITEVKDDIIYHLSRYRVDKSYFAYFATNGKVQSTDTQRRDFLGNYGGLEAPEAVKKGECTNSTACGWSPVGSHCIPISLKPKEKKTLIFILGYSTDKREPKKILKKFSTPSAVREALSKLKAMWDNSLNKFQAFTPDTDLNLMMNVWNQYQCRTTFNWSRSASYYESGIGRGMGYRDSNQDTMGFVHQIPEKVRERLVDLASNQFAEGNAYHQYSPLTKKGAGGGYGDDHIWLVLAVASYIKETGDSKFLSEKVPFAVKTAAAVVGSGEAQAISGVPKGASAAKQESGTIYEHIARSIDYSVTHTGPHGLPLIGFADWNDCLNLNQGKNQAESVMVAQQVVAACREMESLSKIAGKPADVEKFKKIGDTMAAQINKVAWDGHWYVRAFDDDKKPVGSSKNESGKIFLETQGWGVISGVADSKRAIQALDSVKENLATKHGIVILQPAFKEFQHELGSITVYPPGLKENAAIFCHPNPWIMIAECIAGRGDQAYAYYKAIQPAARNAIANTHKTEPYVYCQMIAGKDHKDFGEGKNSWLTGSAAWNFIAASQWILGVRADFDGLRIDPCIPKAWKGFTVRRIFRGATYLINVKNPHHVCKGVKSVRVDGRALAPGQNVLPVFSDKKEHQVEVVLG